MFDPTNITDLHSLSINDYASKQLSEGLSAASQDNGKKLIAPNPTSEGLFDPTNITDLHSLSINDYASKQLSEGLSAASQDNGKKLIAPNPTSEGLFDPTNITDFNSDLNNSINEASAGTQRNDNIVKKQTQSNNNNTVTRNGEAETNADSLDYSDKLGEVSTAYSPYTTQENLERDKASSNSGNSSVLPDMESINEYLTTIQISKLNEMIDHLGAIRQNTSKNGVMMNSPEFTNNSSFIGNNSSPETESTMLAQKSKIKRVHNNSNRGQWDTTYGDYSPGSMTT